MATRGQVVLIEGPWCALDADPGQAVLPEFPAEASRVVFLPRMSPDDFLHLQVRADVLLDTPHFGGGSTSYEAFAFGTPIVTGRRSGTRAIGSPRRVTDRWRWRSALRRPRTITYERCSGWGPTRRGGIGSCAMITLCKHQLFEDVDTVRQLEEFLIGAVALVWCS